MQDDTAVVDSRQAVRWLTTVEVAQQVRVSTKTIYTAVKQRKLRAAQVANGYRFRQEWVEAWLEASATPVEIGPRS